MPEFRRTDRQIVDPMNRHDALELITAVKFDLALVDLGLPCGAEDTVINMLPAAFCKLLGGEIAALEAAAR